MVNLIGKTVIEDIANVVHTSSVVKGTPVKEAHVTEGEETEFVKSTEKGQDMKKLQTKNHEKGSEAQMTKETTCQTKCSKPSTPWKDLLEIEKEHLKTEKQRLTYKKSCTSFKNKFSE